MSRFCSKHMDERTNSEIKLRIQHLSFLSSPGPAQKKELIRLRETLSKREANESSPQ